MAGEAAGPEPIVVTAAVIEQDGRFLVTRRLRGTHLEGYWEFPGGKCSDGEPLDACLRREMLEELDAAIDVGEELCTVTHAYPERVVELHFYRCRVLGEVRAVLGQEIKWVGRHDLRALEFPPADAELIGLLEAGGGDGDSGENQVSTRRNGETGSS
jgi:8-oxo-dGTP diphosphatase